MLLFHINGRHYKITQYLFKNMEKDIKKIIKGILEIVSTCPKELQQVCFEILLTHYLSGMKGKIQPITPGVLVKPEPKEKGGRDIVLTDLHTKAKRFIEKYGVLIKNINQIFYKENESFKPLYDDLGTTQLTKSQIRLAVLKALKNGMKDGNFEFDIEVVRQECQDRKCYDSANFAGNFKKRKVFFTGFEKRKKNEPVKLSAKGKDFLAELIKELSG